MIRKTKYTKVKKFRYSQRLWKGNDGNYYLADESADTADGRAGWPDETDDGPLRILRDRPIQVGWEPGCGTLAMVKVYSHHSGEECSVGVTGAAALWLSAYLGMTIVAEGQEYHVHPMPEMEEDLVV